MNKESMTGSTRKPFLITVERIFVTFSLASYIAPIIAYWVFGFSIIQEVALFFGSQVTLYCGLMIYGVFVSMRPEKHVMLRHKQRLSL